MGRNNYPADWFTGRPSWAEVEEAERQTLEQLLVEADGCGARWVAYERGLIRPAAELEAEPLLEDLVAKREANRGQICTCVQHCPEHCGPACCHRSKRCDCWCHLPQFKLFFSMVPTEGP